MNQGPNEYIPASPAELREILQRLSLTQGKAAQLVCVTRRTMARYLDEKSDPTIPYPMLYTLLSRSGLGSVYPDTWRIQIANK